MPYTQLYTNFSDTLKTVDALHLYGINNYTLDENYCRNLGDFLIKNYPCMKEYTCTPFGTTQTSYLIMTGILLLIMFFVGWKLRGKIEEEKTNK